VLKRKEVSMTELLSPRDAGRLLGLTTSGVVKLALRGRLPELRDSGGRRLFDRKDVEALVEARARVRASRIATETY